ncbi:MAG: hypothetical protein ACOYKZ_06725 [Chlamydiia bacterium]
MAEAAKTKTTRTRRTKAEVQQEFSTIAESVQEQNESMSAKESEAQKIRDEELRETAHGVVLGEVAHKITNLSVDINKALSDISEKIMAEAALYAQVRQAVEVERQELQRVHKVDISLTALDQIIEEYNQQKAQFEADARSTQLAWQEERLQHQRDVKEFEENLKKARQRESEDYNYQTSMERKKAQDKFDEEQRLKERKAKEQLEALQKSWAEREAALAAREEELDELRVAVAAFPKELDQRVSKSIAEATQQTEQRLQNDMLLLKAKSETERKLAELQIKTLQESAERYYQQIQALQIQVVEAKQQVQDIAVKAIDGASGARALGHINQIAMEQAKHRTVT